MENYMVYVVCSLALVVAMMPNFVFSVINIPLAFVWFGRRAKRQALIKEKLKNAELRIPNAAINGGG